MIRRMAFVSIGLLACASVQADIVTGFEAPDYSASAAGVLLTNGFGGGGQELWYNPVAGSADGVVMTYAGNAFGVPANPGGAEQFIAGRRDATAGGFARLQRDEAFINAPVWTVAFDFSARYDGLLPTADFLGSYSLQPYDGLGASRSHIQLFSWIDIAGASTFNCGYFVFDSFGFQVPLPGVFPGPEWENLIPDNWYRFSNTFDFEQNRITEVSITDLTTGVTTTVVDPIDFFNGEFYYLDGGDDPAALGIPYPSGFRLFTGGGGAGPEGNVTAWDNLDTSPAGGGCGAQVCGDANCDGSYNGGDIDPFFVALGTPAIWMATYPNCDILCVADINLDGAVNGGDIDPFFVGLGLGVCPPSPTPPPAPRLAPLRNGSIPRTTPINELN